MNARWLGRSSAFLVPRFWDLISIKHQLQRNPTSKSTGWFSWITWAPAAVSSSIISGSLASRLYARRRCLIVFTDGG